MQQLDALLQRATEDGTTPGAVICVAWRGQIVWQQAYGAAAFLPYWRPMHLNTYFDIASLSKVVATTSLVLLAHQDGLCALDTPLQHLYQHDVSMPLAAVTVRQLLAHTSGLPAWQPLYQQLLPEGPQHATGEAAQARRTRAVQIILQQPLAYAPGTQAVYSDLGFMVLADVLERQYGQALDHLFAERVMRPLGLRALGYRSAGSLVGLKPDLQVQDSFCRSGFSPTPSLTSHAALPEDAEAYAATEDCPWRGRVLAGEVHDENAWAMGGVAGHAGLFATATGLWEFTHALLESAAGRQAWLLPALLQASWQRHNIPPGSTRALGWDTPSPAQSSAGEWFSPRSIGHLGFTGCSLWMDLPHKVTVILCTNRVHPSRHNTGIRALRPAVHNLVMQALGVVNS